MATSDSAAALADRALADLCEEEQPPAPADDQSGKPLGDRLVATAPAVRKAAYLELAAILGGESGPPDAEAAAEHADHIPRLLADRAPICHEGALDATIAWLEYVSPEAVVGVAGAVAKALMEKHAPGKYQPKAIAALLSLLRRGGAEPVQSALEAGVRSKAPKTCAAALKASAEALLECGAAAFDAGPVVKQLPTLLQHRDKSVRDAAAALVGAVRHWLGDGALPPFVPLAVALARIFSQLKGVPEDRLTALREAPLPPTKKHLLQRQGSSAAVVAPPPMAMPPLDLLAKLPRSKGSKEPADAWETQTLSDKWSERKAPRPNSHQCRPRPTTPSDHTPSEARTRSALPGQSSLKPAGHADHALVLRPLKRLYQDANVNAAPALLKRGADKKAVVAEAVRGCLAALSTASCLTLAEAAELALAAMSRSTNTQLRSTAARWLAAAVSAADAEGVGRALDAFDAPLQLLEEDATAE
ncbi:hypothetical protein EMIHUDRAFT_245824, partial [Emiliania huxleyi CCMP1516]|uniref:TOG domain-containing protein n=2 Tax=Emiliania huxleyi TaxID=2903 RepID=A0A0D3IW40_EMIH1